MRLEQGRVRCREMVSPTFTSSVNLNGRRKYYIGKVHKAKAAVDKWSRAWGW